ncbi:alpha/beta hydrolase [Ruminococcus sp.]|uniref:alpha/beta fold hydrolase n=1 Tax=Ruminococcus sp. TaxID=41978 RepID=UPI0025F894E8|nr:alpha/beta hydrolase [Ruminococcus sp.]MBQ8965750.1 alpha/beta hydrolase [Ruminococcus sp.]
MKFYEYGSRGLPVIVMLTGSFCPADTLEYLYSRLEKDYYIIVPEYTGHYKGSKPFSTRQKEAAKILDYLKEQGVDEVAMVYGQSMGAEIGMELISQLLKNRIKVGSAFFDGGPFIRLHSLYKAFMNFKFKTMIKQVQKSGVDGMMKSAFVKKFTKGDTRAMKPMLEALAKTAPNISEQTIRNETECCYTFNFPDMSEEMQENIFFVYSKEEKAFKSCFKYLIDAYPVANYKTLTGFGHLGFSVRHTDEYIKVLNAICTREKA